MNKIIQDIWIMLETGIVVFKRVYDEKFNPQLFGAMMSALDTFAKEITSGSLNSFEISKKKFTLTQRENIIFIVNSEPKAKQKKINQNVSMIMDKFFQLYGDYILDFDGELDRFEGFEKHIEETLEDPIKKFEKGFW